jgi:hypothetical protein
MPEDKSIRSPQEKKALSYVRDRRSDYGENDKASRKAVPRRKAHASRKDRHQVAQDLATLVRLPAEAAEVVESSARHDVQRVRGWRKAPDKPLADYLADKAKRKGG